MRVRLRIDSKHTIELLAGEAIAVKIPKGATVLELQLSSKIRATSDSFAKICDVFFNGRPA